MFLNDVNLLNEFINIQRRKNPEFFVEVFLESSSSKQENKGFFEGSVNLVVSEEPGSTTSHTGSSVLSLNTSLAMTGFCPANQKAKSNTRFYNDIATSNLMGAWGFMNEATEQLWWILPADWDRIDAKTKQIYVNNYMQYKEDGLSHE